jgi:hypothetical protein
MSLEGSDLVRDRASNSLTPEETERISTLERRLKQAPPICDAERTQRGELAELVVEYCLSLQRIGAIHAPINDPRDLIIHRYTDPDKQSAVQVKYLNYATAYRRRRGGLLHFSPRLIESSENFDVVILVERIPGYYEFLVLTKEDMLQRIEKDGKERASDPGREKRRRVRLYVPLDFTRGDWLKSYGSWYIVHKSFQAEAT